jgi:hypothetical protein
MPRDVLLGVAPLSLEKRAAIQDAIKACVAVLFWEGGGCQRAAELFGISTARTYNFANRNNAEQISFWRVAALTSPKATAAVRYLATLAGGVFVPLTVHGDDALKLAAASSRASGRAVAETVDALADKVVTSREAATVLKDIDAAIADLASLRGSIVSMSEARPK